ncbi:MAG TPA: hypothetical protein VMG81_03005 [Thermoplasmata archaeon]|nr:hypothetical protein [Thermoplasmata archaeon]
MPRKPSWEDADLLLRIDELAARAETRQALDWFRKNHLGLEGHGIHPISRDAPEIEYVYRFVELFETVGTLVKHELVDEELIHDRWMSRAAWEFLKPTIERERRLAGPGFAENFEWLAVRNRAFAERRAARPGKPAKRA